MIIGFVEEFLIMCFEVSVGFGFEFYNNFKVTY